MKRATVAVLTGFLIIGSAVPATADSRTWRDRIGDAGFGTNEDGSTTGAMDITGVRVVNGKRIIYTMHFKNFTREHFMRSSIRLGIDTRRKDRGPEWMIYGTNGEISWKKAESWDDYHNAGCAAGKVTFAFRKDFIRFDLARRCVADPRRMRVHMQVAWYQKPGSRLRRDRLRNTWSPWVYR